MNSRRSRLIPSFLFIASSILSTQGLIHFFFFSILQLHLQRMEVPGLGVELEPLLQAYATATAMLGLSLICNLCSSLWQCLILNPLSEAKDQTCILREIALGS